MVVKLENLTCLAVEKSWSGNAKDKTRTAKEFFCYVFVFHECVCVWLTDCPSPLCWLFGVWALEFDRSWAYRPTVVDAIPKVLALLFAECWICKSLAPGNIRVDSIISRYESNRFSCRYLNWWMIDTIPS